MLQTVPAASSPSTGLPDDLSFLVATEGRSLLRQIDVTTPYVTAKTYPALMTLRSLGRHSADHLRRLTAVADARGLTLRAVSFRTDIANLNYLTVQALLPHLTQEKRLQVEVYERAVGKASGDGLLAGELGALLADTREQLHVIESLATRLGPV